MRSPKLKNRIHISNQTGARATAVLRPGALAVFTFAVLLLAGCRIDMHVQPRYDPLEKSTFFPDGRSARPVIPDTVARGHLRQDELLYTGKVNGQTVDQFPFQITRQDLERGRQRFNIYCSPCHGRLGDGDGMVVERGFRSPPSFHLARLREAPAGHYFDAVTNGFGAMPSYASRVPVADRWAIITYLRALQLSQWTPADSLPAADRQQLEEIE